MLLNEEDFDETDYLVAVYGGTQQEGPGIGIVAGPSKPEQHRSWGMPKTPARSMAQINQALRDLEMDAQWSTKPLATQTQCVQAAYAAVQRKVIPVGALGEDAGGMLQGG